jgi:hypothetical protein
VHILLQDECKEPKTDAYQPMDSAPQIPPKPHKPPKPSFAKLPLSGGAPAVQLRSVSRKPVEKSTAMESEPITKASTTSESSSIDSKPISSGGVKSLSSKFSQFSGIPNQSTEMELRLKKFINDELFKIKSDFANRLAQERQAREALEEEIQELKRRLGEI